MDLARVPFKKKKTCTSTDNIKTSFAAWIKNPNKFSLSFAGISGLELTNPCLQARWFLRTYGYQGSWAHILTELVFMTTFIIFRIFYGSYLTYNIIAHPKCHIVLKLGTSCLYIVSWAFIYQMFTYIAKKYIRQAPDDNEEETEKNE